MENTSDIICPHCEHGHNAEYEDYQKDGDTYEYTCHNCDKNFDVTVSLSTNWATSCKEGEHDYQTKTAHPGYLFCSRSQCGDCQKKPL